MRDPKGPTGEMPAPRGYTAMHPTGSRRRGLIPASDCTQTSKDTYINRCSHARRRAIIADIGAYRGLKRCNVQGAPLSGVVA